VYLKINQRHPRKDDADHYDDNRIDTHIADVQENDSHLTLVNKFFFILFDLAIDLYNFMPIVLDVATKHTQ